MQLNILHTSGFHQWIADSFINLETIFHVYDIIGMYVTSQNTCACNVLIIVYYRLSVLFIRPCILNINLMDYLRLPSKMRFGVIIWLL